MKMMVGASLLLSALMGTGAIAQESTAPVQVEGAWARASVPGQQATGAFMRLTASQSVQLVAVETPAAGVGEIHEMKMEGDVMRMRAMDSLALPAGQTVELKPGGYHLMFQQLKAPLAEGAQVPLMLVFRDGAGQSSRLQLNVPVQRRAPGAAHGHAMPAAHGH